MDIHTTTIIIIMSIINHLHMGFPPTTHLPLFTPLSAPQHRPINSIRVTSSWCIAYCGDQGVEVLQGSEEVLEAVYGGCVEGGGVWRWGGGHLGQLLCVWVVDIGSVYIMGI